MFLLRLLKLITFQQLMDLRYLSARFHLLISMNLSNNEHFPFFLSKLWSFHILHLFSVTRSHFNLNKNVQFFICFFRFCNPDDVYFSINRSRSIYNKLSFNSKTYITKKYTFSVKMLLSLGYQTVKIAGLYLVPMKSYSKRDRLSWLLAPIVLI